MSTLLILTLAGSVMTLFCFVFGRILGGSAKAKRIWLTVAALFYLIPLYNLKEYYVRALKGVAGHRWYSAGVQWNEVNDFIQVQTDGAVYQNTSLELNTLIYVIWVTVAVAVLVYSLARYYRKRNVIFRNCDLEENDAQLAELDKLRAEMRIRRKVRLLYCHDVSPVSMGVLRPVIILPQRMRGNIPVTLLKHELTHIKNLDVLMNVVFTAVKAIHWFNPIAYFLKKEFSKVCEMLCDDEAVKGLSSEESLRYAELLVSELKYYMPSSAWAHNLSKDTKIIEERIENIMNGKKNSKIRKCLGAVALAVSMFVCSLTAFAYEDVHKVEADEEVFVTEMDDVVTEGNFHVAEAFIFEGGDGISMLGSIQDDIDMIEILYNEQFIDEDGNIYEVNTEIQPYEACSHEIKSGTYARHIVYNDGHCTVSYYNAEWCVVCGYVWVHDYKYTVTFDTCPH